MVISEWWNQLRWSAKANGWYAKTNEVLLFVPDAVYQRHLAAYLQSLGLEPFTKAESTQLSEADDIRRYAAEETFLANIEYWRDISEQGVEMYFRDGTEQAVLATKLPFHHPLPTSVLAELPRQQEVARLLEYVKAGELTLREAANTIDGLMLLQPRS